MPLPDAEAVLGPSSTSKAKSVRKASGNAGWSKASTGGDKGKKKAHGGRQIEFMVGGMCYLELRSAREVMNATGTDIVVGSTRCIAPADFIGDLLSLG